MVAIWDKQDYLKEAEEQLSCKEMYEEVTDDPSYLIKVILILILLKISMSRSPNSVNFISCLKFVKACIVFQVGPLSLTVSAFLDFRHLPSIYFGKN